VLRGDIGVARDKRLLREWERERSGEAVKVPEAEPREEQGRAARLELFEGLVQLRKLPQQVWLASTRMELRVWSRSFRPSETKLHVRWLRPNLQTTELTFWNCPVRTCVVWGAKMASKTVRVNLWKTPKVSYLQTLSNST